MPRCYSRRPPGWPPFLPRTSRRMTDTISLSVCTLRCRLAASFGLAAGPAARQFQPRPSAILRPASVIISKAPPASGSRPRTCRSRASRWASSARPIDFKKDLGADRSAVPELHLVLRPAGSTSSASSTSRSSTSRAPRSNATSSSTASGIASACRSTRRSTGRPTASATSTTSSRPNRWLWRASSWTSKYTDVTATLATCRPASTSSRTRAAPIPAIGGIGRVYVVPNISITGEVTGLQAARTA